ncbi:unnamed protein product [Eruca vesicaria subsp. sativa]|uniref:DUF6821 domain-containing protein n=1 Tax=Eruca vesicaria subsp. sativa TaxID=29727 RepID=A0ABC8JLA2_ERUVS|nr:unnamed protein product [Eruca vesicaria subsp. sativa]
MEAELLDWELVHGSDTESTDSIASEKKSGSSSVIIDDGEVKVSDDEIDDDSHIEDTTECLSEKDHLQVADAGEGIEDYQPVSGDYDVEEEIGSDSEAVEESGANAVAVDSSKRRETVWWKMPFVLVKYCAFRIGPVWSVSMAAAVMGFLLLGRRLYNIKNKPQRIHLKVAIEYKKVSQVMSQAARLNESFTEVRRVPLIRPALPAPGAWPVLSLR